MSDDTGPRLVCAGCGAPTTMFKPVCDPCQIAAGFTPLQPCTLCEAGLPRDPSGVLHQTESGGHVGRCTAVPVEST